MACSLRLVEGPSGDRLGRSVAKRRIKAERRGLPLQAYVVEEMLGTERDQRLKAFGRPRGATP